MHFCYKQQSAWVARPVKLPVAARMMTADWHVYLIGKKKKATQGGVQPQMRKRTNETRTEGVPSSDRICSHSSAWESFDSL